MLIKKAHLERLKKEGYSTREIKAIESGTSQNAVAQVKKIREALQKDPVLRKRFRDKIIRFRREHERTWIKNRGYDNYNRLFRHVLGMPLIDFLTKKAGSKKQLSVLDDGAGLGVFLRDIKTKLREQKIDVKTDAVVLQRSPHLVEMDNIYEGPSEFFLTNKKYDAIFSYYGSMHYTERWAIKNQLIKFTNLLNRGGVALIGVDFIGLRIPPLLDQMKRQFAKQGFELTYKPHYVADEPSDILMIRRL